jgi:hypothetical protein
VTQWRLALGGCVALLMAAGAAIAVLPADSAQAATAARSELAGPGDR